MPPSLGGLGIIDLEKISRALRLRWIWYFWDSRERPWKQLKLPIDDQDKMLFMAATKVTVGNGNKAQFWHSRWLQGEAPATLFPALLKHSKRKNRSVKEALEDEKWIQDIDHNLTQNLIAEFIALWGLLQDVTLTPHQEDVITWLYIADGVYTAKSAYHLQFLGKITSSTASVTWKTKAPPKCRFFTWLML